MAGKVVDLWALLNAGKKITNGEITIWYKDNTLYSDPEVNNPYMFGTEDAAEDWEQYIEPEDRPQLYCRWYVERQDGSIKIDNDVWQPIEREPFIHHFRVNEQVLKEEIVGP